MAGNFECFHCLSRGVMWDSDFSFEDFGYDGDGIVHVLHCTECGARIEYRVLIGGGDEADEDRRVREGEAPSDEGSQDVQGGVRGQTRKEGSEMEGGLVDDTKDGRAGGVGAGPDRVEEPRWWVFTFGVNHLYAGHYVRIFGTFSEARGKMFGLFDAYWAFQYSQEQWDATVERMRSMGWPVETEMDITAELKELEENEND